MKNIIITFLVFFIGMWAVAGNVQTRIAPEEEKLVRAVETKNFSYVDEILNAEVKEDFTKKHDPSVLHLAIESRKWEVVKIVLEKIKDKRRFEEYARYKMNVPVLLARIEHKGWVGVIAWSPDGSKICTGSNDSTVQIWDVVEKKVIETIQHEDMVVAVAWSPDGGKICTGTNDSTVQIWDVKTKKVDWTFQHGIKVRSLLWSPDGSKVCSVSVDNVIKIWDLVEKELIDTIHHEGVEKVLWNQDGSRLCIENFSMKQVWDSGKRQVIAVMRAKDTIFELALSQQGSKISSIIKDAVEIWDVVKKEIIFSINTDYRAAYSVWNPDGCRILIVMYGGNLEVWDTLSKKNLQRIKCKRTPLRCIWSPDGAKIFISDYGVARIWDNVSEEVLASFDCQQEDITWSPDGRKIFWIEKGIAVNALDLIDKKCRRIECKQYMESAAWNPDGNKICIGSEDYTEVWDVGGTVLDWAVRVACSSGDIRFMTVLLAEIDKGLQGFCSDLLIDFVISKIPSLRVAIDVLEMLIGKCEKLDRLCSKSLLLDLKRVQNSIKASNQEGYVKIENLYTKLIEKGNYNGLEGFCSIDFVISKIPSLGEAIDVLEMLINKCEKLDRLCSRTVLLDLKRIQDTIKGSNPEGYTKIENLYAELIKKGSGWIYLG